MIGNLLNEPDKIFVVNLSAPVNASVVRDQGIGTILNDDGLPALSVSDVQVQRRQFRDDRCRVPGELVGAQRSGHHGQLPDGRWHAPWLPPITPRLLAR